MKANKVRKLIGAKILAGVLAAGMMVGQPAIVFAAEDNSEVTASTEPLKAIDTEGKLVEISKEVLALIDEKIVYLDEETKYLYETSTGRKIDPVTGKVIEENTAEPDTPKEDPGNNNEPETPDNNGETQTPGNNNGGDVPQENPGETPAAPDAPQTPAEENSQGAATNEELVANQQIVKLPVIVEDFRFWTVRRTYAFAKADMFIRSEMDGESEAAGSLKAKGVCYILKEEEDGWLYVESGTVRGFVKSEEVSTGEDAKKILKKYRRKAREVAKKKRARYTGIEEQATVASELIPQSENPAFLHTRSTVNRTVLDKEYAIVKAEQVNIREGKSDEARVVGTLAKDGLCYILADEDQDWIYVESGDVRGFVHKEEIQSGEETDQFVELTGEENLTLAEEKVKPEENQVCYYSLASVKSGVPEGAVRSSLLEFASQFIGNRYVWGGTSLTDGADCSGFVQSIYKQYGYELPRVAEDQAQFGTKIPVEDAQPGDLIFYARDGYVYHVVIYAGDGKTIEAKNEKAGIVEGNLYEPEAVWATRVLEDSSMEAAGDIGEVNATEDMYGEKLGNFKLTYYCSCALCCDVETGITATGTQVVEGRTIAVDPRVIPYGTKVIIGGHVFTAEDCGGAIKGNRIDVYVNDHDRAQALGVNHADVYLVK